MGPDKKSYWLADRQSWSDIGFGSNNMFGTTGLQARITARNSLESQKENARMNLRGGTFL
jgi:hypothetical protein